MLLSLKFSDYFYQFGEIRQVHVVANKCCAFIQFTSRQSAEMAAERTFEQLTLKVCGQVLFNIIKNPLLFIGLKNSCPLGSAQVPVADHQRADQP
jgi:hypothetical protein